MGQSPVNLWKIHRGESRWPCQLRKYADGADFQNFDTSKGRDISLPRFIVGCTIYAKNLANLKSRCLMFILNVAPTGYHAKSLKYLQAGDCAIAPSIPAFFQVLVGFEALATYSRGILGDFLRIPPFQLYFEVTCSHFWGVAPSIPASFWFWLGLHVLHSVLVDFLGIPPFQSAVF